MFNDLFSLTALGEPLTLINVITGMGLAFVLSWAVALTYRHTHNGLSYSQSFTFTLILIGFLISVIMMVIGSSLARAFGAFGAFSLIRFRTAIKDTKDIAFILLVVTIGLAVGTGNYIIAILATLAAIIIIYVLTRVNFGSIRKYDYLLTFSVKTERFNNDQMREVFKEFLKSDNLLNVASRESGQILDYNFNVKFINATDIEKFLNRLNQMEGVEQADLVSAKNDIEY